MHAETAGVPACNRPAEAPGRLAVPIASGVEGAEGEAASGGDPRRAGLRWDWSPLKG